MDYISGNPQCGAFETFASEAVKSTQFGDLVPNTEGSVFLPFRV
jgi:hypothetical protein